LIVYAVLSAARPGIWSLPQRPSKLVLAQDWIDCGHGKPSFLHEYRLVTVSSFDVRAEHISSQFSSARIRYRFISALNERLHPSDAKTVVQLRPRDFVKTVVLLLAPSSTSDGAQSIASTGRCLRIISGQSRWDDCRSVEAYGNP